MPRWRTMIEPADTSWPSPAFTPRRWPTLSRPFFELEPAFLCAIDYSFAFLAAGLAAVVFLVAGFAAELLTPALGAAFAFGSDLALGADLAFGASFVSDFASSAAFALESFSSLAASA